MLRPEKLRDELRRQPFVPLRIHLTDGRNMIFAIRRWQWLLPGRFILGVEKLLLEAELPENVTWYRCCMSFAWSKFLLPLPHHRQRIDQIWLHIDLNHIKAKTRPTSSMLSQMNISVRISGSISMAIYTRMKFVVIVRV